MIYKNLCDRTKKDTSEIISDLIPIIKSFSICSYGFDEELYSKQLVVTLKCIENFKIDEVELRKMYITFKPN